MIKKVKKNNKHYYLFILGFAVLGFLTIQSYISNQNRLAQSKYNYLVDKVKKERVKYWDTKTKVNAVVDQKLKQNKKLKQKLKKVSQEEITRVVFD